MYHLFNSVYVDTEQRIDRNYDIIVISPILGYEYVSNNATTLQGRQLAYAKSLDDWTEEEFTAVFKDAFESDTKVMVYCDGETYLRLYAMLIKIILPKAPLDVWRWIFLCKKAAFDTCIVANSVPRVNVLGAMKINDETVATLHKRNDPLTPSLLKIIQDDNYALSVEWHILRLMTDDVVGKVPKTLKNILRRIALSNAHDAMEVWGRYVTDPGNWDVAGADMDTLMNADSVFEGCLNMPLLSSRELVEPGMYDFKPADTWLVDMLDEASTLMDRLEDESSARRSRLISELICSQDNMRDPEMVMKRVKTMFDGEYRIALAQHDTGKYDENLIRYLLNEDLDVLKESMEGAKW